MPMWSGLVKTTMDPVIELDIRPMVWDASVIAASEQDDVTIILRVTYSTLEQICADLIDVREITPERRPN